MPAAEAQRRRATVRSAQPPVTRTVGLIHRRGPLYPAAATFVEFAASERGGLPGPDWCLSAFMTAPTAPAMTPIDVTAGAGQAEPGAASYCPAGGVLAALRGWPTMALVISKNFPLSNGTSTPYC